MERRRLVGRRYEDYINNKISLDLTDHEKLWRTILSDPRYNPLIERRRNMRRKNDRDPSPAHSVFQPGCSFVFMNEYLPDEDLGSKITKLP